MDESTRMRIRWVAPPIPREVLRDLTRRQNTIAFSHLFIRLLTQALLMCGAFYSLCHCIWWLAVVLVGLNGGLWFFMGWAGIGHELFHATVTTRRRFDHVLFRVFSVLTWSNYGFFEYSHWRHHKLTLFPEDPELPASDTVPLAKVAWYVTIDVLTFYRKVRVLLINSVGIVPLPRRITDLPSPAELNNIVNGARVVLSVQLAMASLFILVGEPWLLLIVTLAPFTCTIIGHILEGAQHAGMQRSVNDYRHNSRTLIVNPLLAAAYANMNYHLEHHLFPAIPYYNLPKVRPCFDEGVLPTPMVGLAAATRHVVSRFPGTDR